MQAPEPLPFLDHRHDTDLPPRQRSHRLAQTQCYRNGAMAGGDGGHDAIQEAFDAWVKLLAKNSISKDDQKPCKGFLIPFVDKRTANMRIA